MEPAEPAVDLADVAGQGERGDAHPLGQAPERAGWRTCGPDERKRLADWLLSRALEHDDAPS